MSAQTARAAGKKESAWVVAIPTLLLSEEVTADGAVAAIEATEYEGQVEDLLSGNPDSLADGSVRAYATEVATLRTEVRVLGLTWREDAGESGEAAT